MNLDQLKALVRDVPDFPQEGIVFKDITPLLADELAFSTVIDLTVVHFGRGNVDKVVGIEARGFLLAGAVAIAAGVGMAPIRKAGKLPRPAASVDYALEYGRASIEMSDDLAPGTRVLLVDDILATGGTLHAGQQLLAELDLALAGTAVLMELEGLGGQAACGPVHSVFQV